jgi:outer membrane murein-binding lipoprotein Lpp
MMTKLALPAVALAFVLLTGCNSKTHPNQINSFDGGTYDTMTAAHSALLTLRAQIATSYPKYTADFNLAAQSYNTALAAYSAFRSAPTADTVALAAEINSVSVSIVALENAIQADLKVPPAKVAAIRAKALHARKAAARATNNVSLQDIMVALELAAQVAEAVPGTQPWSGLAAVLIQVSNQAITTLQAQSGQPIDLATISAIAPL